MATASLNLYCNDRRDNASIQIGIPQLKTGLDDERLNLDRLVEPASTWRCDSSCPNTIGELCKYVIIAELLDFNHNAPYLAPDPPPTYAAAVADSPPCYDLLEPPISSYDSVPRTSNTFPTKNPSKFPWLPSLPPPTFLPPPMTPAAVDFNDSSTFRQAGKKNNKKSQQKANNDNWGDDGGNGANEAGEGGDNAGGGGEGGGGGGGAGGDKNGDGGAGDDGGGDDWNFGGGKKKKKGKKGKNAVDEEEEQKEKEEEEKRKKEEENNTGGQDLSWMNDPVAKPDDEWAGFTSTDKKGKKNKKGKNEVVPEPQAHNAFEDINLGGDTPQLDLNFGAETGTGGTAGNFGFGTRGWGSSWDTGNQWDFSGIGSGAADITNTNKDTEGTTDDVGGWSFGKKNKKTTAASGFDFGDFATLDDGGGAQTTTTGDQDSWATSLTATGKKNKKNKKNVFEDTSTATDTTAIGTAVTEPTTTADDSWGSWGASTKKDKNKKKKNETEPSFDNILDDLPPPPPPPPAETTIDDSWGGFGTKGKKKTKKIEEPAVVANEPEPEADTGWGSFGTKKDKKKGKKDAAEDKKFEPDPIVVVGDAQAEAKPENEFDWSIPGKNDKKKGKKGADDDKNHKPAVTEVPPKNDEADLGWGSFGTGKKDKKKGKKDQVEEEKVIEPAVTAAPATGTETDFGWGGFGTKKDKKKGKKADEEVEAKDDDFAALMGDDPGLGSTTGMGWGSFGAKKDKKKAKGGPFDAVAEEPQIIQVPEFDPVMEDSLNAGWGTTATTKKGKKDKKGGITEVKEDNNLVVGSTTAADEAATNVTDDAWMNWTGTDKKKDQKGKKGTVEAKKNEALPPPPPPPPPVPDVPETSFFDSWGTAKKDKKGKKGRTSEPEPAIVEVVDPSTTEQPEAVADDWASFGLPAKDKKKKEKEKEKLKKEQEDKAKKEQEELEKREKEEAEKKEQEAKEKEKSKVGKKGKLSGTTGASRAKDLMAGSIPDPPAAVEDDFTSGIWGSSKKDSKKKTGKKDSPFEVPPPVPTPPALGFTPPPEGDLDDFMEDTWGAFGAAKDTSKKETKKPSKADEVRSSKSIFKDKSAEEDKKPPVETAAKAARSFWGSVSATPASKPKTTKEKESEKAKKDLDLGLDDDLDLDEIVDIVEEEPPPKKGSKTKAGDSKLAKSTAASKDDKAGKTGASEKKANAAKAGTEIDALIDFDEFETNDTTAEAAKSKGDDKKADAWSFWGSSKKTSGKKGDEPKKEINKPEPTNKINRIDPLAFLSNEPELSPLADEPAQSLPSKPPKSAAMSTSKPSAKLSVAQKVKALEEERKKKSLEKSLEPPPPPPPPVIEPVFEPPAKKPGAASKSKAAAAAAAASKATPAASKKKDLWSTFGVDEEEDPKTSADAVPGSFPAEANYEDNLIDMLASPPAEKKPVKKGAKTTKKEPVKDFMDLDVPVVPAAPPTPPAEPVAPKPVKKERARVVRDQGASSWGFWGSAPKKEEKKAVKAKDDGDVPSTKKTTTPALVRSKSTKTTKEKDKETEKSSGSDGKEKKAETRPAKSRGSSFGGFFGGPPPARTKPIRRTSISAASKTTSKRQSMDIDGFGLPSPPPEDLPAATGKAAKVMGTAPGKLDRKASTKGKQKATTVPDPYPIDDDDMVMVNGIEDPIINAPVPKGLGKSSKDKSSKEKPKKKAMPAMENGDDVVMVDGPSQEDPELLAFEEKPKNPAPLRRSATSAKKPPNGKLMGLFGGFAKTRRNSESWERPKTKTVITDDEGLSPRKRTVNGREDSSKRIRRDDRKVRRSNKLDPEAEVFITDALNEGGPAFEADGAEVRREERRAKREARDADDRRARRRDAEKAADEPRKTRTGERRTRPEDDRLPKDSVERTKHSSSRPHKSDRRKSYMDSPLTSDRPKAHRSRTEQSARKRHSVAAADAVVDDYFDPRNAEAAKNEPYMHGANDHTSSWVKSQLSDPADPPPVEGTVIEPAPELGGKGGYGRGDKDGDDDRARRAARKARRQARHGVEDDDPDRRRRRREKGSEGSAGWDGREREKLGRRYTDLGAVREGGGERPGLVGAAGKRGSWLKKVTGLGM
ncbi:MAG: hypothetical protein Q9219_004628 [cf. Caloplaca sp. 3 TL-2023]